MLSCLSSCRAGERDKKCLFLSVTCINAESRVGTDLRAKNGGQSVLQHTLKFTVPGSRSIFESWTRIFFIYSAGTADNKMPAWWQTLWRSWGGMNGRLQKLAFATTLVTGGVHGLIEQRFRSFFCHFDRDFSAKTEDFCRKLDSQIVRTPGEARPRLKVDSGKWQNREFCQDLTTTSKPFSEPIFGKNVFLFGSPRLSIPPCSWWSSAVSFQLPISSDKRAFSDFLPIWFPPRFLQWHSDCSWVETTRRSSSASRMADPAAAYVIVDNVRGGSGQQSKWRDELLVWSCQLFALQVHVESVGLGRAWRSEGGCNRRRGHKWWRGWRKVSL